MPIFKDRTIITLATGATVLVLSLSLFADNAVVEKTAELPHPVAPSSPSQEVETAAPTAPSAPSGPFAQAVKEEGVDDKAMPAKPIPVAPSIVSMGMDPTPHVKGQDVQQEEKQITGKAQASAEPVKPEAPTSVEKPVEMTPPQPEKNTSGNGSAGNASSMNMPTMNMNMPQMNMPAMNMNMPTTSMGATMTPQAVSVPVPVQQPATSVEH